jgi:phospholipid:diacylglycerol acyltransferase
MDTLRRRLDRVAGKPPEELAREGTPDDERAPPSHQSKLLSRPTWGIGSKRRHAWVFVLGGIFGLLLAAFLANNNDLIDLAGLNLEGIVDVLPAGFMSDLNEFQVCMDVTHYSRSHVKCRFRATG